MNAYSHGILMNGVRMNPGSLPLDFAHDYVSTVTANITQFLRDKPHKMTFKVEQAIRDMSWFWQAIEAEGDFDAACAEWQIKHNARV